MNEESIVVLETGSEENALFLLKEFNFKHSKAYHFSEFSATTKRRFFEALLQRLDVKVGNELRISCLESIRIVSREKSGLETLSSERSLKLLIRCACLDTTCMDESVVIQDVSVVVEAQKSLCNIIFNNIEAQRICSYNGCIEGIVQRLKMYKDPTLAYEIKFFDMRLLFLLTALCIEIRPKLRQELHGLTYLIEVLDLTLRGADEAHQALTDQEVDLCCEVLKILFNVTVGNENSGLDEEEEAHFMRLVSVLHDLLICKTANKEKRTELQTNTVNLLTNMPSESFEELLTPVTDDEASDDGDGEGASVVGGGGGSIISATRVYDGKNMEAVIVLIEFLRKRLDVPQQSIKESLTPILHCMSQICRSNRSIRKFCRLRVLPYLREEVRMLPQEGNMLRNKLCKLFTNPNTDVKDLAADFIFVLCKESVGRFVKYTGYGNAAGLLAQRGLMCGGAHGAEYSSESEDSDTEEYLQLKEGINPVTGRFEDNTNTLSALENMSEEQKEYEAMQLVDKLDKLQRAGFIKPTKISEDGKPAPVEHVAELLEALTGCSSSAKLETADDSD